PHKAEIASPDGRTWLIRGYPVVDPNGKMIGAVEVTLEITQRKQAEQALKESEERYKTLVQTSPDAVMVTDIAGKITYVSKQALQLYGFDHDQELLGRRFFDLIAPESRAKAVIYLHKTLKEGITRNLEYSLLRKNGQRFIGEINTSVAKDTAGNPSRFIATTRDITDRKEVQNQLEESIKEKEFLLQEIHHRVKNNLQVISSILDLSSLRIEDSKAIGLIEDARSKIQTMAFIHSQLYRSERFDRIEMGEHIRELINYLSTVYGEGKKINSHVDIAGVHLSLTQAIPCALVLNELISNAFKHAFKRGAKGTIEVSMARSGPGMIAMSVKDDGVGIRQDLDISKTNSLGLKLVRNLVEKQLKGKLKQKRAKYTEFVVEFPIQEEVRNVTNHGR
ncbi:MAG: PAS domain S-box protein, partial [Candidatus Aminicenantes bacterium]|nr:PAS domain S-box protein [Candidatus Aminicenantes bacterium]